MSNCANGCAERAERDGLCRRCCAEIDQAALHAAGFTGPVPVEREPGMTDGIVDDGPED